MGFVIGRSWVQLPLSAPDFSNLLPFHQFTFPFSVPTENLGTLLRFVRPRHSCRERTVPRITNSVGRIRWLKAIRG